MKPYTLDPSKTLFLAIDLQEKLLPAIQGWEEVLSSSKKLITAAHTLEIPLKVTEQYPKGLGPTEGQILSMLSEEVFEKTGFGCFDQEGFEEFFSIPRRDQVVLFGIETHICVHTTAMQLLTKGYDVTVVSDGCGSRKEENHRIGMANMGSCGAHVLPLESVIYQLLRRSGTAEFKALLPLFKE
ncbi:isochorismatase family protein [Dethiosulfovibrio salsuginis]|uniref:Nicotinamidase-related amidase n=1 Tax=Dethiosulfovibrio salsuginis TaxID=561720 RepID=A0A1X7JIM7_9BACT|nr:isochorismatase family protein [Dethiosulfovibrio salsuginis]SMG27402.1 Nicotinamidase-related amidase [Dethiosulfovibrio salsuginis]